MKRQLTTLAFLLLVTLSFGQGIKGIQPVYYQNTPATVQPDVSYKAPYQQIQRNNELEAQIEYQKKVNTRNVMNTIKDLYNSFDIYPKSIPDGWYQIIAMNNDDFCDARTVYVSNNRITKYFIDNETQREVSYSNTISNAKTTIQLKNNSILDIYFMNYLINY
jgi:hypothetical protein